MYVFQGWHRESRDIHYILYVTLATDKVNFSKPFNVYFNKHWKEALSVGFIIRKNK